MRMGHAPTTATRTSLFFVMRTSLPFVLPPLHPPCRTRGPNVGRHKRLLCPCTPTPLHSPSFRALCLPFIPFCQQPLCVVVRRPPRCRTRGPIPMSDGTRGTSSSHVYVPPHATAPGPL